MSWWLIEVGMAGADPEEVAQALAQVTGQAVEERAASVLGYAADEPAAVAAAGAIATRFGATVELATSPVDQADWTVRWRDGLAVRRVGRLRLGPSWLLEPGPDTVVIDPETAFGSGEHGSTRGALALLDHWLERGASVLDLGSGSGILAIAAAKLGAKTALGIEVDEESAPIADVNALRNQVADRVRFVTGDAAVLGPLAGPVDLVVSNILRTVNESLLGPIARSLHEGGVAIFAGMESPEADRFRPTLAAAGFAEIGQVVDEGWWSVAARRSR